ncbi:hypothetical protein AAZX31_13G055900 [Glycine max]|uniref:Uncharacterized protein n=2 Tax=Glycine subgen. Soja TaxID=1462606 RepID=I1LWE0_SOYBN|nr:uncharacterized protein LOC100790097 isoform X1 [Glycine max]XP_006593636.1 uncharacterized protein LOC100790097 isoform X1 [Glycine max]XP_028196327.1 uncharacterized protein LOC114381310 isoform X1 [Glycine soja]XP_028196328.1 uncharacterized protein LOC114381310 isoform X1 [Glycine soja]XP_028196330.1 uncharacterized protein LOC114381310 isoform X1 [Glycine soja]XP_028196331.1 uncharacterized protein LOC114381310 isoform X1 [Glycine soja]KAG4958826.1 hypothetical protein JHK87_035459 [G|eukprot:XP_003543436.1 uncharacterized protein LOC100790097 isoform X1 [Glycine max]
MVILCSLPLNYSAFLCQGTPFLPSKFPARVDYHRDVSLTSQTIFRIKIREKHANHSCTKFVTSAARNDHHLSYDDDLPQEPFLLTLIKDVIWGLRYIFVFLVEQPGQFKYIEWPSFSSTLRTAILTLILVAMLIVALSSVDSALSYLLALALRKRP